MREALLGLQSVRKEVLVEEIAFCGNKECGSTAKQGQACPQALKRPKCSVTASGRNTREDQKES